MRLRTFWVSAMLFAVLGAGPASAQGGWISYHFGGGFRDEQADTLAKWINDVCRPDEMGNIVGFSYQGAPATPLNLQIFCRQGGTGKLGKVKVVKIDFSNGYTFKQERLGPMQSAAILGFDLAKAVKNPGDPPSGTVVMVVKE